MPTVSRKIVQAITEDLANVHKWYEANGMRRKYSKYQGIVFGKAHIKPNFNCDDTETPVAKDHEILGYKIDEKM